MEIFFVESLCSHSHISRPHLLLSVIQLNAVVVGVAFNVISANKITNKIDIRETEKYVVAEWDRNGLSESSTHD